MKHRLLILGTLGEFVQLVKKSKERGYYTIVCDGYPDGPARQYADASYVIPVTDIDAVADLCQKEKVDGIVTSFSDLLMECMVKIAEKAGLPCYLKPEQLCWYRDKSACRELLSKLGLPTPGFVKVPAAEQNEYKLAEITAGLKYPLISKPLDKYGSRGIFIIKDQEQLAGSVRKTAEFTDLDEILIEEYNDGFEFNLTDLDSLSCFPEKLHGKRSFLLSGILNIRLQQGNRRFFHLIDQAARIHISCALRKLSLRKLCFLSVCNTDDSHRSIRNPGL